MHTYLNKNIFIICNIFLVPPMMWVPAQQMNVYYGQDATLVCVVEAHPDALVYWEFNGQIVQENQGYHMKILKGPPSPKYKVFICYYIREF